MELKPSKKDHVPSAVNPLFDVVLTGPEIDALSVFSSQLVDRTLRGRSKIDKTDITRAVCNVALFHPRDDDEAERTVTLDYTTVAEIAAFVLRYSSATGSGFNVLPPEIRIPAHEVACDMESQVEFSIPENVDKELARFEFNQD